MSSFARHHGWVLRVLDYGQYLGCGTEESAEGSCVCVWVVESAGGSCDHDRGDGKSTMDSWFPVAVVQSLILFGCIDTQCLTESLIHAFSASLCGFRA